MKIKSMMKELKFRWSNAPTWIKVIDICCWVLLFGLIGYLFMGG